MRFRLGAVVWYRGKAIPILRKRRRRLSAGEVLRDSARFVGIRIDEAELRPVSVFLRG